MARLRPLALLVASLAVAARAAADLDPDSKLEGVVELTPDNFDKVVNGAKAALVEFYAPWCGHCRHLTPEYQQLGAAVAADAELSDRVVIAKVNADEHGALGERFRVQGFPTIKFFSRGREVTRTSAVNYNGDRSADAMLAYIKKRLAADRAFARVDALDTIAAKAGKATGAELKKLAAELEEAAGKLEGQAKEHGDVYVKLAKKALDKGADWFATERTRLERMIASGGIAAAKVQELAVKNSVLGGFLGEEKVAPPTEDEEQDEEDEEEEDDEGDIEIEDDDDEVEADEEDDKEEL